MTELGTYIELHDDRGTVSAVMHEEVHRIDAAVERWCSSGMTQDTLLQVQLLSGDMLTVRASTITGWVVSTPEGRERDMHISQLATNERWT